MKIPTKQKEIISYCVQAYKKVGLIRNVIDLMADFGSQGVKIVHRIQRVSDADDGEPFAGQAAQNVH